MSQDEKKPTSTALVRTGPILDDKTLSAMIASSLHALSLPVIHMEARTQPDKTVGIFWVGKPPPEAKTGTYLMVDTTYGLHTAIMRNAHYQIMPGRQLVLGRKYALLKMAVA